MSVPQHAMAAVTALAAAVASTPSLAAADPLAGLAIHHVQVSVANAETVAAWYVANLGFKITKRAKASGLTIIWLDIPGFRLGLAQVAGSRRDPSQSIPPPGDTRQQGLRQIDFSVADVDRAYSALVAKKVRFAVPPTSFSITGIRLATMLDPEGNAISLYQDLLPTNALMATGRPRAWEEGKSSNAKSPE